MLVTFLRLDIVNNIDITFFQNDTLKKRENNLRVNKEFVQFVTKLRIYWHFVDTNLLTYRIIIS